MGDIAHGRHLCLIQILQQRARRQYPHRKIFNAEPCQPGYLKMLFQQFFCPVLIKIMGFLHIYRDPQAVSHIFYGKARNQKRIVADDLRGRVFADLIQQFAVVFQFRQIIIPGRDIGNRDTDPAGKIGDTHQEIIAGFLQRLDVQVRPRRNDSGHFPFDHALCQLRILHLLADRHFIALFDQFV